MLALLKKVNMTDQIHRAIADSLKHMDEETLFIFEPLNGQLGNVTPINDLIGNVSQRLKKKGIEISPTLLLHEIRRVLNYSIKKDSIKLVIARDKLNGLPVIVIKPERAIIEYNKNFPEN